MLQLIFIIVLLFTSCEFNKSNEVHKLAQTLNLLRVVLDESLPHPHQEFCALSINEAQVLSSLLRAKLDKLKYDPSLKNDCEKDCTCFYYAAYEKEEKIKFAWQKLTSEEAKNCAKKVTHLCKEDWFLELRNSL